MPIVLLIRHGESESNIGLPSLSPELVPLTKYGRFQAERIAQRLEAEQPELLVISSFLRSKETAKPAIKVLQNVPIVVDLPVHEFTYLASWRNEYSTIQERKPIVDCYWDIADPYSQDGEGAESFQQFIERVWDVMGQLKTSQYQRIAVFTHEQFILAFRWLLEQERDSPKVNEYDMRDFRNYLTANSVANGRIMQIELHVKVSSSTGPMPALSGA